jgi:hypothetical protein
MLAQDYVLISRQYRTGTIRLTYALKEDADSASAIFNIRNLGPVDVHNAFRSAVEKLELYDFPVNGLKAIDDDETTPSNSAIERGADESEDDYIQRIRSALNECAERTSLKTIAFSAFIPNSWLRATFW